MKLKKNPGHYILEKLWFVSWKFLTMRTIKTMGKIDLIDEIDFIRAQNMTKKAKIVITISTSLFTAVWYQISRYNPKNEDFRLKNVKFWETEFEVPREREREGGEWYNVPHRFSFQPLFLPFFFLDFNHIDHSIKRPINTQIKLFMN